MMPGNPGDDGSINPANATANGNMMVPDYGNLTQAEANKPAYDFSGYGSKKKTKVPIEGTKANSDVNGTFNPFKTQDDIKGDAKNQRRDSQRSGVSFADQINIGDEMVTGGVYKSPMNKSLISKADQELIQLASQDPKTAALQIVGNKKITDATPSDMQKLSIAIGIDEIKPQDLPLIERLTSTQIANQVKEVMKGREIADLTPQEQMKVQTLLGTDPTSPQASQIINRMTNSVPHPVNSPTKQKAELSVSEAQKLGSLIGVNNVDKQDLPVLEKLSNQNVSNVVEGLLDGRKVSELNFKELNQLSNLMGGVDPTKPSTQKIIESMTNKMKDSFQKQLIQSKLQQEIKKISTSKSDLNPSKQNLGTQPQLEIAQVTQQDLQKLSSVLGVELSSGQKDVALLEKLCDPIINDQVDDLLAGRKISQLTQPELQKLTQILGAKVDPLKGAKVIESMTIGIVDPAAKIKIQAKLQEELLKIGQKQQDRSQSQISVVQSEIPRQESQKLSSIIGVDVKNGEDLLVLEKLSDPKINNQVDSLLAGRKVSQLTQSELIKLTSVLGVDPTQTSTQKIIEALTTNLSKDPILKEKIQIKLKQEINKLAEKSSLLMDQDVSQMIEVINKAPMSAKSLLLGRNVSTLSKEEIKRISDQILRQSNIDVSGLDNETSQISSPVQSSIPINGRQSQFTTSNLLQTQDKVYGKINTTLSQPEILVRSDLSGLTDQYRQQYGSALENPPPIFSGPRQYQGPFYEGETSNINPSNQYLQQVPSSSYLGQQPRVLLNSSQADDFYYPENYTIEGNQSFLPQTASYPTVINDSGVYSTHHIPAQSYQNNSSQLASGSDGTYQGVQRYGGNQSYIRVSDHPSSQQQYSEDNGSSYYKQESNLPRIYNTRSGGQGMAGYAPSFQGEYDFNERNGNRQFSPSSQQYQQDYNGQRQRSQSPYTKSLSKQNQSQTSGYQGSRSSSYQQPLNTLTQQEINQRFTPQNFSSQGTWSNQLIGQLKNVEQFMEASFQNLDSKLKQVNYKIGETKQNALRFQLNQKHQQYSQFNTQRAAGSRQRSRLQRI